MVNNMARSPETCPGERGLVALLLASVLFATVVSPFFAAPPAGAQGRRARTPKQETQNAAGTANSSSAQKKRLTPLRSSDSQQGGRLTITSDGVLSAYSAYRSGDRFYVVIPKADAPGAQSQARGRGYEDVRMQKRGDDTVLSFRLQPGAKAHVEQKFNKLDVVINAPEQPAVSNTPTGANATRVDKTNTAAVTSPAGTRNGNRSTQNSSAQPAPSPEGTTTANTNQPANAAARGASVAPTVNGTTPAPGNTALPPLSSVMPPAAPSPSASSTPAEPANQVAQAQPTVPSATTISNPGASDSSLGAAITRHWLPVLFAALLLLGIIGVVAARSMTQRRAVPPPSGEKEVWPVKASPISGAALAPSETAPPAMPLAAVTATKAAKEASKAVGAPTARREAETKKRKEAGPSVELNRAEAEVKKLLAGRPFDEAVIGASDAGTRQIVAAGLLSALAGRNISRREIAREAFIKHNYLDEATTDLRTAKAPAERASAARSLGFVRDRVSTSHLIAALDDTAPEVRRAAVEALADLGDPAALAPLESLLEREKDRQVPRSLIKRAISASAAGLEEERAPTTTSPSPAGENLAGGTAPSGTEAGISTEAPRGTAAEDTTLAAESPAAELPKPSGPTVAEAAGPAVVSEASSVTAIEPLIEEAPPSVAEAAAGERAEAEAARQRIEEERTRVEAEEARQRAEEERRRRAEEEKARQRQEALRRASEERQRAEARRQAEDAARLRQEEEEARRQAEPGRPRARAEEATPPSTVTEVVADAIEAFEPPDLIVSPGIKDSSVAASSEASARGSETADEWIDLKESGIDLYSPTAGASPPAPVEKSIDRPEAISAEPSLQAPESLINPVMLPDTSAIELVEEYPAAAATDKTGQIVADKSIEVADEDFSTVPGAIRKRLGSEDVNERASAIIDLANVGGEDSFREITAAFDDPSTEVRNAAARALYNLGTDRAASFTRALREAPPERRRHIGGALASSGLAGEAIGNLTGESRDKTYDAFSLLFLMSKAGEVQPLMKAIEEHPNNEVRLAVVKLLALSGQQEILPAFRRLAVRGSLPTEVRSAVMEAIYQISSQASSDTPSAA